ncbi:uncharacterized protein LOC142364256 [Opisthocomus hoazin]|uniref:uncharacterized protein LOC142364256 n=1 Tax=Opisthocomus hoazin TaxID=30419 RepID=UPI003F53DE8A
MHQCVWVCLGLGFLRRCSAFIHILLPSSSVFPCSSLVSVGLEEPEVSWSSSMFCHLTSFVQLFVLSKPALKTSQPSTDWRRCLKSGKEKYQLLLELGGKALGRIFQADLGFGLLGEFLMVLAGNVCHEDRDAVLQILRSLSGTKHFGLNVELLSESEKESRRDLFGKLQSMSRDCWAAGRLSGPAGCEAEREADVVDTSPPKEAEEERMVMELMKCYQVN